LLFLFATGRIALVAVDQVTHCSGAGDYVELNFADGAAGDGVTGASRALAAHRRTRARTDERRRRQLQSSRTRHACQR